MATPEEERIEALKKDIERTRKAILKKKRKNKKFESNPALSLIREATVFANRGEEQEANRRLEAAKLSLKD